jgi:hypothetical protein
MELARVAHLFLVPLVMLGVLGEAGVTVEHRSALPIFGVCIIAGAVLTIASWAHPARDRSARILASILYTGLIIYFLISLVL